MREYVFTPENVKGCCVTAYFHGKYEETCSEPRPAVVVCPGGGYGFVSAREGEPVAKKYFAAGYQTFVLDYSIKEKAKNFQPLIELLSTIAEIRSHAQEWGVAADKIAVCGFSAGGHLAASSGTLYNEEKFLKVCPNLGNIRPDAMILGYPVITADEFAHQGSIQNVSGAPKGTEEYEWFGLDKHVDADTPQTFLWHTAEDGAVPVENSLKFVAALSASKVPFEYHVLPKGAHGMSVCTKEVNTYDPYNGRWVEWSIQWLNKVFDYEG